MYIEGNIGFKRLLVALILCAPAIEVLPSFKITDLAGARRKHKTAR